MSVEHTEGSANGHGSRNDDAGPAGNRPGSAGLVDIAIPLADMWTYHELGASERATAESELAEMLADQVDDPEAVASASMDEFMQKLGAGSLPLLVASFREDLNDEDDDESAILAASLIVTKNDLSGSLDPWREAYGDDADEVEVLDAPALRIEERMNVKSGDLFAEPVQVVTWRYVVPFGPKSVLLFAFSTPNHELDDLLLAHVDEIMRGVTITPSVTPGESSTPTGAAPTRPS